MLENYQDNSIYLSLFNRYADMDAKTILQRSLFSLWNNLNCQWIWGNEANDIKQKNLVQRVNKVCMTI